MKTGVILMAQGFPAKEDQLRTYLDNVHPDREPPKTARAELANALRKIGGECPQSKMIRSQRDALADAIGRNVYIGLQHWEPSIYTAVARAREDRVGRLVAIVLTPHYARGIVGECLGLLKKVAKDMQVLPVWSWASQPLFIEYWASQINPGATVLFTAPKIAQAKAGLFLSELQETIHSLRGKVPIDAHLAFHSIVPMEEPSTGPDLWEMIKLLRKKDELLVAPIGFTCDQLEISYTLDRVFRKKAEKLGIGWTRLPLPNANPILVAALARVVHSVL